MDCESDLNHGVAQILRHKRKIRKAKACYPCRSRKVKCDFQIPCDVCVKRDYPELCSSRPTLNRISTAVHTGGFSEEGRESQRSHQGQQQSCPQNSESEPSTSRDELEKLGTDSNNNANSTPMVQERLTQVVRQPNSTQSEAEGLYEADDMTGELVFLGPNARPSFIRKLQQVNSEDLIGQDFLNQNLVSLFGLNNRTAAYPFNTNLWLSNSRVNELCKALPSDAAVLLRKRSLTEQHRYYRLYRQIVYPFYPVVVNVDGFESGLCDLLQAREEESPASFRCESEEAIYGKTLAWVGLLFALLASGCQASDLSFAERGLTSRVFVCCSFECLRLMNFFVRPSLESIQTLLVLGNVLENDLNPGISWGLLGLTIRQAQSLGLHVDSKKSNSDNSIELEKRQLWWAVVWQDSMLSIAYDRVPSTSTINSGSPFRPSLNNSDRSYIESMYTLCKLTLDIVNGRMASLRPAVLSATIQDYQNRLDQIQLNAKQHLREKKNCKSIQDRLEYLALQIHLSFLASELYRPVLTVLGFEQSQRQHYAKILIKNLEDNIGAFLELQQLSANAITSWEFSHRAFGSAFLLSIIRNPSSQVNTRSLIKRLVEVLNNIAPHSTRSDGIDETEASLPYTNILAALRRLKEFHRHNNN